MASLKMEVVAQGKLIELAALFTEVLGMMSENMERQAADQAMAYFEDGFIKMADKMRALLSDDAVPMAHGKWIDDMDCSVCGYTEIVAPTCHSKYCPNCGVKMEGVE